MKQFVALTTEKAKSPRVAGKSRAASAGSYKHNSETKNNNQVAKNKETK